MVAPYNPSQSYTPTGNTGTSATTTPTTTPAAAPFPGTGTTAAPASTPATIPGLPPPPPTTMTWPQFEADNHLSSTDMPIYTDSAGNLNGWASWLINYKNLNQSDRQNLQQEMVNAGLLAANQATGKLTATSNTAVLNLIGLSNQNQADPLTYLGTSSQGKLGALNQQLAAEVTAANTAISSQPAVSVNLENPTTLSANVQQAWDSTLGYAADPAQINAFVQQIQSQDVGYQTANQETNRTQAEANLTRAQNEQAALKALGPDDVGTFVTAWDAAVHGSGLPGAGTQQGPATSSQSDNGQYMKPGTPLPPNTTAGFNSSGAEMFANTLPTQRTTQVPNTYGLGGALKTDLNPMTLLHPSGPQIVSPGDQSGGTHPVTTSVPTPGMATAPALPAGLPGTTPIYGGYHALSPALWKQALAELGSSVQKQWASKPLSQVPKAIQDAAFTALSSALFDKSGNWADVAITLAGGAPGVTGKSNIQSFATQVANEVNDNIASLTSQAATQPIVTTKIAAPDAVAEANLAAKNSDPIGYTAGNYSSWAGTLSKMLYGPPSTAINQTSDTFTGPVSPPAGVAASAPQATAA